MAYINTAADSVEQYINSALSPQVWEAILDSWQSELKIYLYPIKSIESITYLSSDGTEFTLHVTSYSVNLKAKPAVIRFNNLPNTMLYPTGAITINMKAGYLSPTEIPMGIIHAIKLLTSQYYENREPQKGEDAMPAVVKALLEPYRLKGAW